MIEEQEVVRVARARSSEMIAAADAKSKELRRVASEYVDDLMRQTEQSMSEALNTIRGAHESFQALGGGIARQQEVQAQTAPQPARQTGTPVKQATPQRQQPPRREQAAPQGRPDPVSPKIQRIERESE